jgi:hypothetical protein
MRTAWRRDESARQHDVSDQPPIPLHDKCEFGNIGFDAPLPLDEVLFIALRVRRRLKSPPDKLSNFRKIVSSFLPENGSGLPFRFCGEHFAHRNARRRVDAELCFLRDQCRELGAVGADVKDLKTKSRVERSVPRHVPKGRQRQLA